MKVKTQIKAGLTISFSSYSASYALAHTETASEASSSIEVEI